MQENEAEFETLLIQTQVRWLSKGKALERVLKLRNEIQEFLSESAKPELHYNFCDNQWLLCLAFMVDIFESINNINNLALQGKNITMVHSHEKMSAFSMKVCDIRKKELCTLSST